LIFAKILRRFDTAGLWSPTILAQTCAVSRNFTLQVASGGIKCLLVQHFTNSPHAQKTQAVYAEDNSATLREFQPSWSVAYRPLVYDGAVRNLTAEET
jgi:hypothetical protein